MPTEGRGGARQQKTLALKWGLLELGYPEMAI